MVGRVPLRLCCLPACVSVNKSLTNLHLLKVAFVSLEIPEPEGMISYLQQGFTFPNSRSMLVEKSRHKITSVIKPFLFLFFFFPCNDQTGRVIKPWEEIGSLFPTVLNEPHYLASWLAWSRGWLFCLRRAGLCRRLQLSEMLRKSLAAYCSMNISSGAWKSNGGYQKMAVFFFVVVFFLAV